jgi:drug/metabolite transporter (DMT)-like permease
MAWFFYALLAAVLWGASYVIYQVLLKSMSSASVMLFSVLGSAVVFVAIALGRRDLSKDWDALVQSPMNIKLLLSVCVINAAANIVGLISIRQSNATLMGMVEISYPLFTALFAWMFLKEMQLTVGTALGALLIMSGVGCIYYFNKAA